MSPVMALDRRSPDTGRDNEAAPGRSIWASATIRAKNADRARRVLSPEEARRIEQIDRMKRSCVTIEVQDPATGVIHQIGSGFVVRSDGVIATNAHVAGAIEGQLFVNTYAKDETTGRWGTNNKYRVISKTLDTADDVALLKIDAVNLEVAPMGDSSELHDGESVVAIGNSWGWGLRHSAGIANLPQNRDSSYDDPEEDFIDRNITTDTDIHHGNSGGVLMNTDGEVVGITTYGFTRSSVFSKGEIGGARPINDVRTFINHPDLFHDVSNEFQPIILESLDTANFDITFKKGIDTYRAIFERYYSNLSDAEKRAKHEELLNYPGLLSYFAMILFGKVMNQDREALVKYLSILEAEFGVKIHVLEHLGGGHGEEHATTTMYRVRNHTQAQYDGFTRAKAVRS